jgi:hypothetical protein
MVVTECERSPGAAAVRDRRLCRPQDCADVWQIALSGRGFGCIRSAQSMGLARRIGEHDLKSSSGVRHSQSARPTQQTHVNPLPGWASMRPGTRIFTSTAPETSAPDLCRGPARRSTISSDCADLFPADPLYGRRTNPTSAQPQGRHNRRCGGGSTMLLCIVKRFGWLFVGWFLSYSLLVRAGRWGLDRTGWGHSAVEGKLL